jgi:hypothetical protein
MIEWLDGPRARIPADMPPSLTVIVDTEEEFDWAKPHSRANRGVTTIAAQVRAQEVFARYGVVPTYVIDHPVAADPQAVAHLRRFADNGRCEIGAHLHPWVNPPDDEAVIVRNSYPGNLPAALEREKLTRLTETIARSFGKQPTVYKAGRYGIGANTATILEDLGYDVDASLVPRTSFSADGGPDFTCYDDALRWFGRFRRLLEIPLSVGFAGLARTAGAKLYPHSVGPLGLRLHVPGVLARSGVLERIRLSPENSNVAEQKRLTKSLLDKGQRIFSLTYHSPSLEAGHTPFVRDARDLADFIDRIDHFCRWFIEDLGGRPTTPTALFATLSQYDPRPSGGSA